MLEWLPPPPDQTSIGWFYAALIGAAVVIGIAKSGFGGGVGILAVPLVVGAMPNHPGLALGVMLPVLIAADVVAVAQHRRHADWKHLKPALLGAGIGIAIGSSILLLGLSIGNPAALNRALKLIVGLTCLVLVGLQAYRLMGGKVPPLPHHRLAEGTAGGLAGGVSTLAHAAGPIMTIYWLDQKFDKARLTGTLVMFFFVVNLAKLPTFVFLPEPLISWQSLRYSLVLALFVPIGSIVGLLLHRRVPEKPFAATLYIAAAIAAVRMIAQATL